MGAFDLAGVIDRGGQLGVGHSQYNPLPALGQIGVEEQFKIIVNNSLTDRVDVCQSIGGSFKGKEANQADNLQ